MTLNLINDPWIPVRTKTGYERIAVRDVAREDILAPASARPDFDAAILEFLVGLLQTVDAPVDEMTWDERLAMPDASGLKERLRPFGDAFSLVHAKHPFLQEAGLESAEEKPISELLIDTPGAATAKENKDHFTKRREGEAYCPACAALALLTLQSFAPAGGRGNLTSIRGGGPLSTVIVAETLWRTLWANVLPSDTFARPLDAPDETAFPWLRAPDAPSGKRPTIHAHDVHRTHVFWGMPRRVLLSRPTEGARCAICGEVAPATFASYRARPNGLNYDGSWEHPLSPVQEGKEGEISARKARSDIGGYRHWIGLVASSGEGHRRPARVIHHYRVENRGELLGRVRLRAAGYDMDNAKVLGWYEGTMGLVDCAADRREAVDSHARLLVGAASEAAGMLRGAYKEAHYDRPKDVKGDLTHLSQPLWTRTEAPFYASLDVVAQDPANREGERARWWRLLRRETRALFHAHVQYTRLGDTDPMRVVKAERKLENLLYRTLAKELDIRPEDHEISREEVAP